LVLDIVDTAIMIVVACFRHGFSREGALGASAQGAARCAEEQRASATLAVQPTRRAGHCPSAQTQVQASVQAETQASKEAGSGSHQEGAQATQLHEVTAMHQIYLHLLVAANLTCTKHTVAMNSLTLACVNIIPTAQ
jgi:hypothetical protein